MSSAEEVISKGDQLYNDKKREEAEKCFEEGLKQFPNEIEIIWRYTRTLFDAAEEKPNDKNWKQTYFERAFEVINKGLEVAPDHWSSHKWWAICSSSLGDFQSTTDKIKNAFKIKEHSLRAAELKPDDATTQHMLGRWCYSVASIGWLDRKLASTLFATPPESSYEEAIGYFLKAAELQPSFPRNAVFLGDSYSQIKKYSDAKEWYTKALKMEPESQTDELALSDAKKKLSKL
eukprot:TRINITY_DN790_c0_g2_i2.p1 TRINITY_DN790_c0_g2~~TRINITY_DN790_c0_g2_i2.p1  ORF type:complete len:233 (-),score=64.76 TRINITY_DN790_c0_g2_i2:233-931(-)